MIHRRRSSLGAASRIRTSVLPIRSRALHPAEPMPREGERVRPCALKRPAVAPTSGAALRDAPRLLGSHEQVGRHERASLPGGGSYSPELASYAAPRRRTATTRRRASSRPPSNRWLPYRKLRTCTVVAMVRVICGTQSSSSRRNLGARGSWRRARRQLGDSSSIARRSQPMPRSSTISSTAQDQRAYGTLPRRPPCSARATLTSTSSGSEASG